MGTGGNAKLVREGHPATGAEADSTRRHLLLLQMLRIHDPTPVRESVQVIRGRFPQAHIALLAPANIAYGAGDMGWLDELITTVEIVSARSRRALASELRARRFDLVCLAYDDARLPGQAKLEIAALAAGAPIAWLSPTGLVALPRWRLVARLGAETVLGLLLGAAVAVVGGVLMVITFAVDALTPRRRRR
jgi:hypothetical protein